MMTENMNKNTKDGSIHILASEFVSQILTNYLLHCFLKEATKVQMETIGINITSWFRLWKKEDSGPQVP